MYAYYHYYKTIWARSCYLLTMNECCLSLLTLAMGKLMYFLNKGILWWNCLSWLHKLGMCAKVFSFVSSLFWDQMLSGSSLFLHCWLSYSYSYSVEFVGVCGVGDSISIIQPANEWGSDRSTSGVVWIIWFLDSGVWMDETPSRKGGASAS